MGRPEYDDSPDTSGGNDSSTETNLGVHYNSPPPGETQYRGR